MMGGGIIGRINPRLTGVKSITSSVLSRHWPLFEDVRGWEVWGWALLPPKVLDFAEGPPPTPRLRVGFVIQGSE